MQSEDDRANPPPTEPETFAVEAARLAWGAAGRESCEGDIPASYSADLIAMSGRLRKPFRWKGALFVSTSISGSALTDSGMCEHDAYRIVPVKMFVGTATTYRERTGRPEDAEAARNDPNGFYHGMTVSYCTDSFVLCGPPIRFIAGPGPARPGAAMEDEPLQLTLF